jgi:hypothetical protein
LGVTLILTIRSGEVPMKLRPLRDGALISRAEDQTGTKKKAA